MKRSTLFLIAIALGSFIAGATLADDGSKPLEIPDFSKVHNPPPSNDSATVKGELVCRRADGTIVRQENAGYESCVMEANLRHGKMKVGTDPLSTGLGTPNLNLQLGN